MIDLKNTKNLLALLKRRLCNRQLIPKVDVQKDPQRVKLQSLLSGIFLSGIVVLGIHQVVLAAAPKVPPTISITRTPNPMVAGQPYTLKWSVSNSNYLHWECTSAGTGFKGSGDLSGNNGSMPGTADPLWVGNNSTCTYTTDNLYGDATKIETLVTNSTPQSINFPSLASVTYGVGSVALGASASSGLAINYTTNSPAVCTIAGAAANIVGTGTCSINANQPGNGIFSAAAQVTTTFVISQSGQSISFGALAPKIIGAAPFAISATASSGLGVNFTSTTPSICIVSGVTVSLASVGTCTIAANQGGNGNFVAASQVNQSFVISPATQSISFGALASKTNGDAPFALSASASSGLAISYTTATPSVCAVSGATVSIIAAGTCTIAANQAGNSNYSAAAQVTQSFTVAQATLVNGAQYIISQSAIPSALTAGQVSPVSVTMKNTGTSTWAAGSTFKLGSQNPRDNTTWGTNRIVVASAVAPSQSYTFNFTITAPATAGNYNFQWQMLQEGVDFFGDLSTNVSISVSAAATPPSAPIPVSITPPHTGNPIAGSLAGDLSINANGGVNYSIPIAVPPGTAGMIPSISLQYSSDDSAGSAGLGWSVGGLSNIERCGRTVATEGRADTTRLVDDDRLCLDGQHLILVNGDPTSNAAYWADNAQYRTELDSFSRITAQVTNGKRSFKVETKTGHTLYFGDTPDSLLEGVRQIDSVTVAYRWRMSRRTDRSGNYLSYTYSKNASTGESKPQDIRWGGNTTNGQNHYAKARFNYVPRPDARSVYVAGNHADERLRLDSITTTTDTNADGSGGTVAQNTKLSYELSPSSGRSLLSSVQLCDGNNICLPATTFQWGKPNPAAEKRFASLGGERVGPNLFALGGSAATDPNPSFSYATKPMDSIVIGDFNGDGKMDILERYRVSANNYQQRLYLSNADGTGWDISTPFASTSGDLAVMEIGDFDGDGQLDILVGDQPFGQYAISNWRICHSRLRVGQGFVCDTPVSFPADAFSALSPPNPARLVKDFNADGRDDIFLTAGPTNPLYPNLGQKYLCLSTGSAFDCLNVTGTREEAIDGAASDEIVVGSTSADVDGDGRVDNIVMGRCVWRRSDLRGSAAYQWYCGTFGGGDTGGIQVTGQAERGGNSVYGSWFAFPDNLTGVLPSPRTAVLTSDLNADGYSDMVFGSVKMSAATKSPQTYAGNICYSKGDGTADCRTLPTSNLVNGLNLDHLVLTVGDFDGDGIADVLRPGMNTWDVDTITSYQLCHIGADATTHTCDAWQGPNFYSIRRSIPFNSVYSQGDPEDVFSIPRSMFLGDFNGDGKTDIVSYLGRDYNGGDKWQISAAVDQANPNEAIDKLISTTNGVGLVQRVDYARVNDTSIYNPVALDVNNNEIVTSYPIKRATPNRQLAKTLYRSNGQVGWLSTGYTYAGYANDGTGRGNLGFARQQITDQQSGSVTTNWYRQDYPYNGMLSISRTTGVNDDTGAIVVLNQTSQLTDRQLITQANGKTTVFPFIKQSTTTRRDLNGSDLGTTISTQQYNDGWGNLTQSDITSQLTNGPVFTTSTVSTFNNDATTWRLAEVRRIVETKTVPGSSIARQKDYTYNTQGLLDTETRQSNDGALQLKTTYDRSSNVFGLVNQTKLDWYDPATGTNSTRITSQTGYDGKGRFPISTTNALNQTVLSSFAPTTGAPTSHTNLINQTVYWDNDGFGRKIKERNPDGNETQTLIRQCDSSCPAGATTVLIQDRLNSGNRTTVPVLSYQDSAGHVIQTRTWGFDGRLILNNQRYDSRGRLTETDWPRFDGAAAILASSLSYDNLNRIRFSRTPDESGVVRTSETRYQGSSTILINAKGQSKTDTRDVAGRLLSSLDANNGSTFYEHDAYNNLTKTTDPTGNVITVSYDALGRKTDLRDPDLGWIHYDVDPLGQVWRQISPKQRALSQSTRLQYDALGRLITRLETDLESHWIYDTASNGAGQLAEAYTGTADRKDYRRLHTYDSLGRPDRSTQQLTDGSYTSQTSYDTWGRLSTQTYQRNSDGAKAYRYQYNGTGNLSALQRIVNGTSLTLWQVSTQDAAQRTTGFTLGNGLQQSRSYNANTGRLENSLLQQSSSNLVRLQEAYQYDALGNVLHRSQYWQSNGFEESFGYDGLNRLQTAGIDGMPSQTFTYDGIGNLLSKTGVGTGNYLYPTAGVNSQRPHAVQSIPGIGSFFYDDNGNLTNGAGRSLSWTSYDMPDTLSKTNPDGSLHSSHFVYGPEHQRLRQDRLDQSTGTSAAASSTLYAGAQEVETRAGQVTVKTYWPMALGVEIDTTTGSGSSTTTSLNWTHSDRLGSVVAITDQSGNFKEQLAYDAWGKRRTLDGRNAPNSIPASATPDSLDGQTDNKGYTGHEMLDQLDLVHMNGRIYDPLVARFMSADPLIQDPEHSQSYNRYTYVWNNPTNLTDPTGFAGVGNTGGADASATTDSGCNLQCQELRRKSADCAAHRGSCSQVGNSGYEVVDTKGADNSGKAKTPANATNSGGSWADNHLPRLSDITENGFIGGTINFVSAAATTANNFIHFIGGGIAGDSDMAAAAADRLLNKDRDATIATVIVIASRGVKRNGAVVSENVVAQETKGLVQNPMFKDAVSQFKNTDLTNVGRALSKHPEVIGETKESLRRVLRTDSALNNAAADSLKNIMRNGARFESNLPRYGDTVTYQIPGGFGARFEAATNKFIGFINP